ncbi:MAG: bifunctional phosphopantothenoylcysteine decarboxylase/phosphopantothenate--cysteine ligase CoaBC [Caldisericia bacterium]|nr:bifunctional phosphopantothenoylcysteine decarboxylase/phosphopantothenate--cysteine ligase CoaBC [Caldisericia bacterium]
MRSLNNKKVLIGITGGIAAYKVPNLIRDLIKLNCEVKVILSESAVNFVTPYTLKILTKNDVFIDQFETYDKGKIIHTSLANWPDLYVIVPATANTIAKIRSGIADNLITLFPLSSKTKILLVPSMHTNMYENEITQENLKILKERGFYILEPEVGALAGGDIGKGRLPENDRILFEIIYILYKKTLERKKVLITAGPTREFIDRVRFISNPSSGKMGFELAIESVLRGAETTLISGPVNLSPPPKLKFLNIISAEEMFNEVANNFDNCDYLIMSSAVCDFKPKEFYEEKIKKENFSYNLELEETIDILKEMGKRKKNQKLIGFALETENLIENAKKKFFEKNLDMLIINTISYESGFEVETNKILIMKRNDNKIYAFPVLSKGEVAKIIFDFMEEL